MHKKVKSLTLVRLGTLSALHAFFYKQHFYKQRQVEIAKKSSKS